MKRTAAAMTMLAALGGCMAPNTTQQTQLPYTGANHARNLPGVVGPWGQPVPAKADGTAAPATGVMPVVARGTAEDGVVHASGTTSTGGIQQAGMMSTAGKAVTSTTPRDQPQGLLAKKAIRKNTGHVPQPPYAGPPGAVAAIPGVALPGGMPMMGTARSSVRFVGQDGMNIGWFSPGADGKLSFKDQVTTPGRYNFLQGGIYRLKLSNIPKRAGVELYPTIEVVPQNPKTTTFLAHSAIPLSFTDDDFEQVASGNFVVKVIYLPDPTFQELATGLPDEVVSTKLEPGVDPIQEAQRRGSVLLIIRMGNIDLETPNSPGMDAPNPYLRPNLPPPAKSLPAAPKKVGAADSLPTPSGSAILP